MTQKKYITDIPKYHLFPLPLVDGLGEKGGSEDISFELRVRANQEKNIAYSKRHRA